MRYSSCGAHLENNLWKEIDAFILKTQPEGYSCLDFQAERRKEAATSFLLFVVQWIELHIFRMTFPYDGEFTHVWQSSWGSSPCNPIHIAVHHSRLLLLQWSMGHWMDLCKISVIFSLCSFFWVVSAWVSCCPWVDCNRCGSHITSPQRTYNPGKPRWTDSSCCLYLLNQFWCLQQNLNIKRGLQTPSLGPCLDLSLFITATSLYL